MMVVRITLTILVFTVSLIFGLTLLSLSSVTTVQNIPDPHIASAFKPTNKNNNNNNNSNTPPIAKLPVINNNNHPPIANAGPDQTVNENTTVALVGAGIDSDANDKLSYLWRQTAGPAVLLSNRSSTNPTFTAPKVSADTQLRFSLTVTDNKGAESDPANVVVTVKHINHPPIANAGINQTVKQGYAVTLDGSASKDPDNDPLSYSWKQTGGQPSVKLDDANTSRATFTAPSNITADTDLVFTLTVKDDKGAESNKATVKVTVKYNPPPNQLPIANAGQDKTVNAGDTVSLDGSGSKDPDGTITSYSWKQTSGPAVTLNGSDTSSPIFTAPSVSSDTIFKFSLIVKDDKGAENKNPATVSVTVKGYSAASSNNTNETTEQTMGVACGEVVAGTVNLTSNLVCSSDGLIVGKDNTTINLNGHSITGPGVKDSRKVGIVLTHNNGLEVIGPGAIRNFQIGILVDGLNNAKISSLNLEDNQIGVLSNSSSGIRVSSNEIRSNTQSGIEFTNTSDSNISKNDVIGNVIGVHLDGSSSDNVISSNEVTNNSVVDLKNGEGLPTNINANSFTDNKCKTSKPEGLC